MSVWFACVCLGGWQHGLRSCAWMGSGAVRLGSVVRSDNVHSAAAAAGWAMGLACQLLLLYRGVASGAQRVVAAWLRGRRVGRPLTPPRGVRLSPVLARLVRLLATEAEAAATELARGSTPPKWMSSEPLLSEGCAGCCTAAGGASEASAAAGCGGSRLASKAASGLEPVAGPVRGAAAALAAAEPVVLSQAWPLDGFIRMLSTGSPEDAAGGGSSAASGCCCRKARSRRPPSHTSCQLIWKRDNSWSRGGSAAGTCAGGGGGREGYEGEGGRCAWAALADG